VFFLGEELSSKKLLGILIVLAGAAVILQRGRINHHKQMNQ
jgi:drug/metabolite transporter (DMT)-like permease